MSSLNAIRGFLTKRFPETARFTVAPELRRNLRVHVNGGRINIDRTPTRQRIVVSRQHTLYIKDMLEGFDFFHSAVKSRLDNDGYASVDYSSAADHDVEGFPDFPVRFTTMSEPMSTTEQYIELSSLAEGQTVLDLGCYCGLTSIVFSKVVGPAGRVLAVDADTDNLENARVNLERHTRTNGLENVDLIWAAVAPHAGEVTFSTEGTMGSAPAGVVGSRRGTLKTVPAVTLGDLGARMGRRVDFVKMDIEGSEAGVLESAGDFIASHRPMFVIEPHVVAGEPTYPKLIEALERHGYSCRLEPQRGAEDLYLPLVVGTPGSANRPTDH